MNSEDQCQKRSNSGQRRLLSNSYTTAWQIQSTISSMEKFIKLIEQSQSKKSDLQPVVCLVPRMRKFDDEKEYLNKQLKKLFRLSINQIESEKQSNQEKDSNKQKNIIFENVNKLTKIAKQVKSEFKMIEKRIQSVKNKLLEERIKKVQERKAKIKILTSQLHQTLSSQSNFLSQSIYEKQKRLNVGSQKSVYQNTIIAYIRQKLPAEGQPSRYLNSSSQNLYLNKSSFSQISNQEDHQSAKDDPKFQNSFSNADTNKVSHELGQIKCKLASLQDQKRKITVKNILKNKQQKNFDDIGCGFDPIKKRSIEVTKQPSKMQRKIYYQSDHANKYINEASFFNSFFSLFVKNSTQSQNSQASQITKDLGSKQSSKKASQGHSKDSVDSNLGLCLEGIDNIETRLRIVEINSQIVQLKQHMNIIINQNLIEEILTSAMTLKQQNQDLKQLLNQLIEVIFIYLNQKDQQIELASFDSSKGHCQNKPKFAGLKQNQNIKFFMRIISSKFSLRNKIVLKLICHVRYSIKVAVKYLKNKLLEIKDQYELFLQGNWNSTQKIKPTQALRQKTQIHWMNSTLQQLKFSLNDLIQNSLYKFQKLFKQEISEFFIHFESIQEHQENPATTKKSQNQQAFLKQQQFKYFYVLQVDMLQRILQSVENKKESIYKPNVDQNIDFEKDLKQQFYKKFFMFHQNLISRTFEILNHR